MCRSTSLPSWAVIVSMFGLTPVLVVIVSMFHITPATELGLASCGVFGKNIHAHTLAPPAQKINHPLKFGIDFATLRVGGACLWEIVATNSLL